MKNKNISFALLFITLAMLACNLPGGTPTATATPLASETATSTSTPTSTPTATEVACTPTITTTTDANVRNGPGQVYGVIGFIPQGGKANVAGKNFDGTWWYIDFAGGEGGHGWIAGSITSAACIPSTLASIAAPPTPVIPPTATATNTPVVVAPVPTSTLGFIFPFPIFPIKPSPTPTLVFQFPVIPPILIFP